jgi:hypothetical protein
MTTRIRRPALAMAALLAAGCTADDAPARGRPPQASAAPATQRAECEVGKKGSSLENGLEESSGLAESRTRPGVYWSHNDSGHGAELFLVAIDGRNLGRVEVEGATNHDWEDMAAGRCPGGAGECLYIADTGDNARGDQAGKQPAVRLAVVPEPAPGATKARAREYEGLLPGGRTDIEAVAVLPDGRIYLVSKGLRNEVELFRWPTPLRADAPVTLERVRQLAPVAVALGDRVTGASASPNGRWVAVRTYAALAFYRTEDLLGSGGPFAQLDLESLAEAQGEAVSLADDGTVVLTSEGPGHGLPGSIAHLRCVLPR